jgi:hypothetical protein
MNQYQWREQSKHRHEPKRPDGAPAINNPHKANACARDPLGFQPKNEYENQNHW